MGLNELSPQTRVKKGKKVEDDICECLNKHYGFNLVRSSHSDDTRKKIDRYEVTKDGRRIPVQVKGRFSGKDILYDLYEPYCGIGDPRTTIGRDHRALTEYGVGIYICLSPLPDPEKTKGPIFQTIRVVRGDSMRSLVAEIEKEWAESSHKLPFYSEKYQGCELKWHEDKWSGTPKVLCFINTDAFAENKDIKFYKLITEETSNV